MAIYVVTEGDNLSAIAEAHGTTLAEIIGLNPQIANPDLIHPGQEVHVPAAAADAPVDAPTEAAAEAAPPAEATAAVVAEAPTAEVAPAAEQPAAATPPPVLEGRLAE